MPIIKEQGWDGEIGLQCAKSAGLTWLLPAGPLMPGLQVHGTCLGFEALAIIASGNHSILSEFDAENLPSPIFLTGAPASPPCLLLQVLAGANALLLVCEKD